MAGPIGGNGCFVTYGPYSYFFGHGGTDHGETGKRSSRPELAYISTIQIHEGLEMNEGIMNSGSDLSYVSVPSIVFDALQFSRLHKPPRKINRHSVAGGE